MREASANAPGEPCLAGARAARALLARAADRGGGRRRPRPRDAARAGGAGRQPAAPRGRQLRGQPADTLAAARRRRLSPAVALAQLGGDGARARVARCCDTLAAAIRVFHRRWRRHAFGCVQLCCSRVHCVRGRCIHAMLWDTLLDAPLSHPFARVHASGATRCSVPSRACTPRRCSSCRSCRSVSHLPPASRYRELQHLRNYCILNYTGPRQGPRAAPRCTRDHHESVRD